MFRLKFRIGLLFVVFSKLGLAVDPTACQIDSNMKTTLPAGTAIELELVVFNKNPSASFPATISGSYRLLEGTTVLASGPYASTQPAVNGSSGGVPVRLPVLPSGFHSFDFEFTDATAKLGWCRTQAVFYVGPPPPGGVIRYLPDRFNVSGRELSGAVVVVSGWNDPIWKNYEIQLDDLESGYVAYRSKIENGIGYVQMFADWIGFAQPTKRLFRIVVRELATKSIYFGEKNVFTWQSSPSIAFEVAPVTRVNRLLHGTAFTMQASLPPGYQTTLPLDGTFEWYDGSRKLSSVVVNTLSSYNGPSPPRIYSFLPLANEGPGVHNYRFVYVPRNPAPPIDPLNSNAVINYTGPGEGTAEPLWIETSTDSTVTVDSADSLTDTSPLRFRARVTWRGGTAPDGNLDLLIDGNKAASGRIVNGAADIQVANLSAGAHRVELRYLGFPGYLPSTATANITVGTSTLIRHSASGAAMLSPGSLASVYGKNLADGTVANNAAVLPTSLGNVTLTVVDRTSRSLLAGLLYVSPGQINFLMPDNVVPGPATIAIAKGSTITRTSVNITAVAPGVFTMDGAQVPAGVVAVRNRDGSTAQLDCFDCSTGSCRAKPVVLDANVAEAVLILYGSGWKQNAGAIEARVGGLPADVLYAGSQLQFPGLDQANIRLTPGRKGKFNVQFIIDNSSANPVEIEVR